MPLVSLDNVGLAFSGETVLSGVSLQIQAGERVVVIGRNGAGKTSLLELIHGSLQPDEGSVACEKGLRIGYMRQISDLDDKDTVFESVLSGRHELIKLRRSIEQLRHEAESGDPRLVATLGEQQERYDREGGDDLERRAALALQSVGFDPAQFEQEVRLLSGGERSRLTLARILILDADLLLLDEPTNHLDIRATEFLESFLVGFAGAAVVVSHDRAFFDRFATRLVAVERDGNLSSYPGNYEQYRKLRAAAVERQQKEFDQQRARIAKDEEFIRRTHAGMKHKQAKSRQKQLDRVERVEAPGSEQQAMGLRFQEVEHSGKVVFAVKGLTLRPGGQVLLQNASFLVGRGERIGIIGPNGCGKTTLLKALEGKLSPEAGKIHRGFNTLVGVYDQDRAGLTTGRSVLQELASQRPDLSEQALRDMAGRFLFHGDDVHRPVESFSGGEQSRLALALLVLGRHNVLLLDEPTNHLDLPSREVLEEALATFPGGVITVSHDRVFLDRVAARILSFEGRSLVDELGTYSELRRAGRIMQDQGDEPKVADLGRKQAKRDAHEARRSALRAEENRAKRIQDLEKEIHAQEAAIAALLQRMADPSMALDWEGLERLSSEKKELELVHERALAEWDSLQTAERDSKVEDNP
jgi:ATP-binding cassette subfamily F protein 3